MLPQQKKTVQQKLEKDSAAKIRNYLWVTFPLKVADLDRYLHMYTCSKQIIHSRSKQWIQATDGKEQRKQFDVMNDLDFIYIGLNAI